MSEMTRLDEAKRAAAAAYSVSGDWADVVRAVDRLAVDRDTRAGVPGPAPSGPGTYRKRPVGVEAHQWFKNGDHPDDNCRMVKPDPASLTQFAPFLSEGDVVRRFRRPDVPGDTRCREGCGFTMHDHGWIDTLEGGHAVCPGAWIITGIQGERYPCKPGIFAATYERAGQEPAPVSPDLSCAQCAPAAAPAQDVP